jgi:Beta-lactamase class C and other penicillin binding proteins
MRRTLASLLVVLAWVASPAFAQDGTPIEGDDDDSDRANLSSIQYSPQSISEPTVRSRQRTLADLDGVMMDALQKFAVPGASLAVATSGRLVYAKGFGTANVNTNEPVTATTLFNLASCTKAVSTLGVLTLVNAGRLNLDDRLYDVIGRPRLPQEPDPRMLNVTIRQLLHHSAGWNDDGGYKRAGQWLRRVSPEPLPFPVALNYLLSTPLDYDPGTQAVYANGDWNIIKYVIECAAQQPYRVVMKEVLAGIGIYTMKEEHRGYFPARLSATQEIRPGSFPPAKMKTSHCGRTSATGSPRRLIWRSFSLPSMALDVPGHFLTSCTPTSSHHCHRR